jgi:hypothetical protein
MYAGCQMSRNRVQPKETGRHLEVQYTLPFVLILTWENYGLSTMQMYNTVFLYKPVKLGFCDFQVAGNGFRGG